MIDEKDFREEQQMTGYTVHTGSSDKFAVAWDRVFQDGVGSSSEGATKKAAKKKVVVQAKQADSAQARRRLTKKSAKRG